MAKPSMCCFGGAGLDTMLVTSIDPGNGAGQGATTAGGRRAAAAPGVAGVAETPFPG
jgi:sugar lactone lactonase YvrE